MASPVLNQPAIDSADEIAVHFQCSGNQLIGVIHRSTLSSGRGIIMLSNDSRRGPHRWHVMQARELAEAGFPVLRYSAPGCGESEGVYEGEHSDLPSHQHDLARAIDEFFRQEPNLREVILWGWCRSAAKALLHAPTDPRISGVILVNLYLQTEHAGLQAVLSQLQERMRTRAFWRRLLILRDYQDWIFILQRTCRQVRGAFHIGPGKKNNQSVRLCLADRLADALRDYRGRVLFIFSGHDVAATTAQNVIQSKEWRKLVAKRAITIRELPEANHSFSRRIWRENLSAWTLEWLNPSY